MEAVVTTLIGLFGGLALSALLWYVTVHVIRPRLEFSTDVSRIVDATDRIIYRVKLRNPNQRRGIIDLTIKASMRYPTAAVWPRGRKGNLTTFKLHVRNDNVFRLAPKKAQVIDIDLLDTLAGNTAADVIATLYPIEAQRVDLDLESLLRRSVGAHLLVRVLCYDEWSGSRKYFESKRYVADDVKRGHFRGMSVAPEKDL